jgi:hypothetical protein
MREAELGPVRAESQAYGSCTGLRHMPLRLQDHILRDPCGIYSNLRLVSAACRISTMVPAPLLLRCVCAAAAPVQDAVGHNVPRRYAHSALMPQHI